ncbi:MAG: hypothetical protein ACXACU_18225 [Candidatus Hodarchaeales archaeon]|jgi:hypothetical protein
MLLIKYRCIIPGEEEEIIKVVFDLVNDKEKILLWFNEPLYMANCYKNDQRQTEGEILLKRGNGKKNKEN